MSRHGYADYVDDPLVLGRYRGRVASAIRGRRGQAFLRELASALDAMPEKRLIAGELQDEEGSVCAIGAVCKARGLDVSKVDYEDSSEVGELVGIAGCMAAEIEYENDENYWGVNPYESEERRWERMRKWVDDHLQRGR